MQTDCLPAGGAVRVVDPAVSPVTAIIKGAAPMNASLSDKMKMPSKLF